MEFNPLDVIRVDFRDVLFIFLAKDNFFHASPFGGEYLFFDATHRQDFAPKGNFSRHGYIGLGPLTGKGRR